MARATYSCTDCGSTIEVTGRNRADADSRARWGEKNRPLCWECEKRHRTAKLAAAGAVAAEAAQQAGLPALTGSAKQIAWAETIRAAALPAIEREAADSAALVGGRRLVEGNYPAEAAALLTEVADAAALIVAEARAQTDASWWIDNRDAEVRARQWLITTLRARPQMLPTALSIGIVKRRA
jgi:hypothetical protein